MSESIQPVVSALTARVMRSVGIDPDRVRSKHWLRCIAQDESGLWAGYDRHVALDEEQKLWTVPKDEPFVMSVCVGQGRQNDNWKNTLFFVPCGTRTGRNDDGK